MSTKGIIWIVVGIAVVAGGWYWWSTMQTPATAPSTTPAAADTQQSGAISSGSSDADLNTDLNSVDTQLQGANSDSASVDQSFNDQPVQQTE